MLKNFGKLKEKVWLSYMTINKIEKQIEDWIEKRNIYPDIPGILECLAEHRAVLNSLSTDDLPPWISLEDAVLEQEKIIKNLEELKNYAEKYNIKSVL